ncbi:PREDICTED: calmodulin-like protein 4 [Gekko japonicus]|uniref:Calglandulin n=1 Tax=Gekko japonicus TaxID=146911 RepID=A0ABM1K8P2_GEKJA|nr:PREDICTED: calmodulin-like protein 4 [Gekko japonicus]
MEGFTKKQFPQSTCCLAGSQSRHRNQIPARDPFASTSPKGVLLHLPLLPHPSRLVDFTPSTEAKAKFLSQDQINEFKECFSLYDKKRKGKIKASDLITVMRCLGASPTPGEVAKHLQAQKVGNNAELDFSTFLSIMHKQTQQEDPENEILLAMLMTDEQKTGFITVAELKAKLTGLGEKLSGEEVNNLLKEAKVGHNGLVKYEDLVKSVTSPVTVDH